MKEANEKRDENITERLIEVTVRKISNGFVVKFFYSGGVVIESYAKSIEEICKDIRKIYKFEEVIK